MKDTTTSVHDLLSFAVEVYEEGLQCLEQGEFEQLDDIMFRRKQVLDRLRGVLAPGRSLSADTKECAQRVMSLEEDFIERVDEAVIQIRSELVRTKRSRNEANAYERARP